MRRQQHQETKPKQVHHNRTENASRILYSTAVLCPYGPNENSVCPSRTVSVSRLD